MVLQHKELCNGIPAPVDLGIASVFQDINQDAAATVFKGFLLNQNSFRKMLLFFSSHLPR